jgi:cytoskeletal protein CcmA (bactofilin family)
MFGKQSTEPAEKPRVERKEQSFLQHGVTVEGDIDVAGDLRVEGSIKGTVKVSGVLMIGSQANVEADLVGREVVIHGQVTGTMTAKDRIHLSKGAKVRGDLNCQSLVIEEGVFFQGRSRMDGSDKPLASASHEQRAATPPKPASSPQRGAAGLGMAETRPPRTSPQASSREPAEAQRS